MQKETYLLEKSFGPVATFAGYIILVTGILTTFYSLTGIILLFFGAFIGFSYTSTTIDYSNRKVKFSNNIFGLIRIGQWMDISNDMKIGAIPTNITYRTYSLSNRFFDFSVKEMKVFLYNKNGLAILPLRNISNTENIKKILEELSKKLELTII